MEILFPIVVVLAGLFIPLMIGLESPKPGTKRHSIWIKINHKAYMVQVRKELEENLHELNLWSHQFDDCSLCVPAKINAEKIIKTTELKPVNKWIFDPVRDVYSMYENYHVLGKDKVVKTYQQRTDMTRETYVAMKRREADELFLEVKDQRNNTLDLIEKFQKELVKM